MADAGPDTSDATNSLASSRYRLNLLLFVLLAVGATVWFRLHLEPLVTTTSLLGGTLTLWGLWKLLQQAFLGKAGKEVAGWTQKLLGRASATEPLVFALVVLALLYGLTSSIYLEFAGAKAGESSFEVEVWQGGNPWLDPLDVTSTDRVKGQPFLLALGVRELELRIVEPAGFEPQRRTLWPWTPLRLEVPGDFERRRLRALRLIPGVSMQWLPDLDSVVTAPCTLRLSIDEDASERKGEELLRLDDVREQPLLTGAPAGDLDLLVGQIDATELEHLLEQHLTLAIHSMPPPARAHWLVKWRTSTAQHPGPLVPEQDQLLLEIQCPGSDGGAPRMETSWRSSLADLPGDEIKTWILEVGR